jgi:hypothetical protein
MVANTNITAGTSAVVLDNRMWAGSDPASTAWISGTAEGGLHLLIVDLKQAATGAAVFSLDSGEIAGIDGTRVVALLGATNPGASPAAATDYTISGGTVTWTAAAADVARLSLLYV